MSRQYTEQFAALIRAITAQVPRQASSDLRSFVEQYYIKMPLMELEKFEPQLAVSIARSSFEFVQQRTNGKPKIRLFTPSQRRDGWTTDHTILEVLNDDMPFLVDSLTAELTRLGFSIYHTIHPILHLTRSKAGKLTSVAPESAAKSKQVQHESLIHFQLSALPAHLTEKQLVAALERILGMVRLTVQDWRPMMNKASSVMKQLGALKHKSFSAEERGEARDFLGWLCQKNFVFLGYVEYDFYDKKGAERLCVVPGSEMGVFRSPDADLRPKGLSAVSPELLHFARQRSLIEITKANRPSVVHRAVPMDYIGIKRFDKKGKVVGESRFLGLFTSVVYYQVADQIPFIRSKIARTLERANFDPMSHNGKALKAILEFYPRDELFQISEDDLFEFGMGIMSLEARPEVRLFIRKDVFERFMSCMVYIPRDRFSSYLREQIERVLERALKGKVSSFYTQLTESPLARVHLIVSTTPGKIPAISPKAIEEQIAKITNLWSDSLREALVKQHGEKQAERYLHSFASAFPGPYINAFDATDATYDIAHIEAAAETGTLALDVYLRPDEPAGSFHLKVYSTQKDLPLSDMLPLLENMGCKVMEVNPYLVKPKWRKGEVLIRDFRLRAAGGVAVQPAKARLIEALIKTASGIMENDPFNALVLQAGLNWREVVMLRAYYQYLRQIGLPYGKSYTAQVLGSHPGITRTLVDAFSARFDPDIERKGAAARAALLEAEVTAYLEGVSNVAEDTILRRYLGVIQATWRTNYYQTTTSGDPKPYLSFKLNCAAVPGLPLPKPMAEIFVYSPAVEGIHLRGGKVARGGLRWSDRREDFRTEVLGLVKAQMVKNAVIVPVGSKGGFVLKQPPADGSREALMKQGVACYQDFLRGLLDLTDNIVQQKLVPPPRVVRHDDDDPYLVVAADKGTATFSDYANAVSKEYGFWLGDAFASGGSAGYDHKVMGITARGGWVSVERHFREMGLDPERQEFTCVGIGDMSGDVFGNGMLMSPRIRLVAAFNHLHIFLDPAPDAKKTFAERQRLFKLPRSSWTDYNAALISAGGGVFERSAKSVKLSKEVRALLKTDRDSLPPDELIKLILKAPVDLLWNGGIGTYVKAASESHDEVGDRSNNALRVNGDELRCKVVGEGGNLGFTQRGRIEYARSGGRINTDAIDNSGGVDCSDHEVNIKIAFGNAVQAKRLSIAQRDKILESMTDEVAQLVLKDNRLQTQALTVAERQGFTLLEPLARLMHDLERQKLLDRTVEFLPSDKALADLRAARQGLTRPELAVLLAYSKMALYRDLIASPLVDDPHFTGDLLRYFPAAMQKGFAKDIAEHRLRREIVGTVLTNSIVNRAGITFIHGMMEETGYSAADVARAYAIARDAFDLRTRWNELEALDGVVDAAALSDMLADFHRLVEHSTRWFLRHVPPSLDIGSAIRQFQPSIREFAQLSDGFMSGTVRKLYEKRVADLVVQSVPAEMAKKAARVEVLMSACDVIAVAQQQQLPLDVAGRIYFQVGARLRLSWMRRTAAHMSVESFWDRLALKSLISDLYARQRELTRSIIASFQKAGQRDYPVESWFDSHEAEFARYLAFTRDIAGMDVVQFPVLILALKHLDTIVIQEPSASPSALRSGRR